MRFDAEKARAEREIGAWGVFTVGLEDISAQYELEKEARNAQDMARLASWVRPSA